MAQARNSLLSLRRNKYNSMTQLRERHHAILRLIAIGMENKEIAHTLGVSPQMVSDVRNSPIGQVRIETLRNLEDSECKNIYDVLQRDVPKNYKLLMDVRDGKLDDVTISVRHRIDAAKALLDREGHGPTKNIHFNGSVGMVKRTDIEEIKAQARKAKMMSEADYEEVEEVEEEENEEESFSSAVDSRALSVGLDSVYCSDSSR